MSTVPVPLGERTLAQDVKTCRKLEVNLRRNREQDHTALLDQAAADFRYEDCRDAFWNPEEHSLLYGTPLWEQASASQRVLLNQLYWVAYYAQIVSAEIATIFFNQTSAAGLYAMEDFRIVCDTLDLESAQERAHIHAFRKVSEAVEREVFGERVFTYPMRGPYAETMIYPDSGRLRAAWKRLQLRSFGLLSSGNAFIACQYFTVRGIRTLSGKLVQHQLAQFYMRHPEKERAPIPSRISYYHFMDESFHFNSSTIIGHDVLRSLKPPTPFERHVANLALKGCQRDHAHFSAVVRGIFWYEPATFPTIYRVLRSRAFGMDDREAREMMRRCFCEENDGVHAAFQAHRKARESYRAYLDPLDYVSPVNREMRVMGRASVEGYLRENRRALARFAAA